MPAAIVGVWDVTLKTPIGSIAVTYTFADDPDGDGGLAGVASSKNEEVPVRDIAVVREASGERVTWRQSVTKPIRLNLEFEVVVAGAELTGHSRAGKLPRSTVTGARRG